MQAATRQRDAHTHGSGIQAGMTARCMQAQRRDARTTGGAMLAATAVRCVRQRRRDACGHGVAIRAASQQCDARGIPAPPQQRNAGSHDGAMRAATAARCVQFGDARTHGSATHARQCNARSFRFACSCVPPHGGAMRPRQRDAGADGSATHTLTAAQRKRSHGGAMRAASRRDACGHTAVRCTQHSSSATAARLVTHAPTSGPAHALRTALATPSSLSSTHTNITAERPSPPPLPPPHPPSTTTHYAPRSRPW
jgi:hypothetical protein